MGMDNCAKPPAMNIDIAKGGNDLCRVHCIPRRGGINVGAGVEVNRARLPHASVHRRRDRQQANTLKGRESGEMGKETLTQEWTDSERRRWMKLVQGMNLARCRTTPNRGSRRLTPLGYNAPTLASSTAVGGCSS